MAFICYTDAQSHNLSITWKYILKKKSYFPNYETVCILLISCKASGIQVKSAHVFGCPV